MTTQHVPAELLEPVIAYFRPRRIVLFGSAARGEAGPNSDIDLLVILDDDAPREKLTLAARNLPHVELLAAAAINPVSLARHDKVLATVGAVKLLEERLQ